MLATAIMLAKLKSLFSRRGGTAEEYLPAAPVRHRPATNVIMPSSRAAEIAAQARSRLDSQQPQVAPSARKAAVGPVSAPRISLNLTLTDESIPEPPVSRISVAATEPAPARNGNATPENVIEISFEKIVSRFPQELSELILGEPSAEASYTIEIDRAVQQLSKGAVTVTLGELRQQAPSGLFADAPQFDEVSVALPLGEIISKISPSRLNRRNSQKQVVVPEDVTAPFQAPAQSRVAPASAAAALSAPRIPMTSAPAAGPAPKPESVSPAPVAAPKPLNGSSAPSTVAPRPAAAAPAVLPASRPVQPVPAVAPKPAAPVEASPAVSASEAGKTADLSPAPIGGEVLRVEVQKVSEGWPKGVQEEIATLGAQDQCIEIPVPEIELGLRSGKIMFTWSQVREWIPAVASVMASSPNDSAPLEMPLKVVAPIFLAQRKNPTTAAPRARSQEFEAIPNLFGGAGAVKAQVANAAPVVSQAAVQQKIPGASLPQQMARAAKPEPKEPKTIAEVFGSDPSANATPADVLRKTVALPGVAGAMVCTPDGLVVAEQLASPVGGETFGALMTQMFHRVAGYAKELKLGGTSQVSFVADDSEHLMVQTPRIFLIAVGKPKSALPLVALRIIARHLGE